MKLRERARFKSDWRIPFRSNEREGANLTETEFEKYFKEVKKHYDRGDYTEGTFRTPFENFMMSLSPGIKLVQEPRRVRGLGAPDFKAFNHNRKVGFIETKDLDKNLDVIFETEQIKKYVESINNLILTNYTRFILIRNGEKIFDFNLFSMSDLKNPRFRLSDEKIEQFKEMANEFFLYKMPTISSAEELASELSRKAKLLKDFAKQQLEEDLETVRNNEYPSSIYDFYVVLNDLIKDIETEDCADAYAQTITYGLFLAAKNCKSKLERRSAASYIPRNIGIIKRIFLNISGDTFPSNISWIIDDIVDILNSADIEKILAGINKRGKKDKDPIIFFYEDFLNFYEPERRKHMGVYYTPRPVVSFIVNSVNGILKTDFGKLLGFAEDDVHVLDPAIGTGTFFWIAFLNVLGEMKERGLGGLIDEKIEKHLLKHFYGFELLITPYVVAHLKLGDLLGRWGYEFKDKDRIQVYLTNTLEPAEIQGLMAFSRELTEESRVANQIKLKKPILAVIGNPPYSGMSANNGEWITRILKEGYKRADGTKDDGYYKVDGKPLGEKNPKWLQDDYVKFIRYAQWKIDKNGEGVVGYITNHSYLDNPTFRGMRESLLRSFDRIYILNLHGNSLKKEKCPDGSKDENVFDIRQGVAIAIFIKNPKFKDKKVYYADLWGTRDDKYNWLDRHTIDNTKWQEIEPASPFYFFIPVDRGIEKEYMKFWKVTDIFPVNSVGIVTARDKLTIRWSREEMWEIVKDFSSLEPEEARRKYNLGKDARDWKVELAQKDLKESGPDMKKVVPILYRPFDVRYTYYTGKSRGFQCMPRPEVMKHILEENLGLITVRQVAEGIFNHTYVSEMIIESRITLSNKGIGFLFPLYLYGITGKEPNINPEVFADLERKYGVRPEPEAIFYYIYAVLHSPTYRKKYEQFLRYDFPRIPFVDDYGEFKELSELGKELVELHLMKRSLPSAVKFDIPGSNTVEKVKYEGGRVWINKEQYFEGVPEDVWTFHIGGYQVLDKWLKSRKGRELDGGEVMHFIQVVEVIKKTLEIMARIDRFPLS